MVFESAPKVHQQFTKSALQFHQMFTTFVYTKQHKLQNCTTLSPKLHHNCTKTAPKIHHDVLHTFTYWFNYLPVNWYMWKTIQVIVYVFMYHLTCASHIYILIQLLTCELLRVKDNPSNCVCVYVSTCMCFAFVCGQQALWALQGNSQGTNGLANIMALQTHQSQSQSGIRVPTLATRTGKCRKWYVVPSGYTLI